MIVILVQHSFIKLMRSIFNQGNIQSTHLRPALDKTEHIVLGP